MERFFSWCAGAKSEDKDQHSRGQGYITSAALAERRLGAFMRRALPGRRPPGDTLAPPLASDAGGWFDHWDDDGEGHMGEGDVLRALVHSLEIRGDRSQIQGTADLALLRRGYSVDESPRLWIFPC